MSHAPHGLAEHSAPRTGGGSEALRCGKRCGRSRLVGASACGAAAAAGTTCRRAIWRLCSSHRGRQRGERVFASAMSRACVGSAATRLFASLRCGDCAAVLPIRCAARALQSSAATMSTNKVASTLLFALFALPSRVAAQDEYIRWIADPSDQTRSCASVCADAAVNGGGGACTAQSLARQHAVNSEPTLRAAMLAVASARLPGASTAWPCTSWNPQAQAGPSRWNGQCFYSTGASGCGTAYIWGPQRLCCCLDANDDAATAAAMCPVGASSCGAGYWFDTANGFCVPNSGCRANWYLDSSGASPTCKSCGGGTAPAGSTSPAACTCSANFYFTGVTCHTCGPGTSPSGSTLSSQCTCDEGFWMTAGVCTSAFFRWRVGQTSESCDTVCANAGTGLSCNAGSIDRQNEMSATDIGAKFDVVLAGLIADQGHGAAPATQVGGSGGCGTTGANAVASMPGFYTSGATKHCNFVSVAGGSVCAISTSTYNNRRLCCCLAEGEDPATFCPVRVTDCGAGAWWESSRSRCVSNAGCEARWWKDTVSDAANPQCVACGTGKFGPNGMGQTSEATACTGVASTCGVGTFGASLTQSGMTACADCPPSAHVTLAGSMYCTALSRWYAAEALDQSCDAVCAASVASNTCSAGIARANLVDTANKVTSVLAAASADKSGASATPWSCLESLSATAIHAPYRSSANKCYWQTSAAFTCASQATAARRICCCPAPGEDAALMCPLSPSDCDGDAQKTFDFVTGRCVAGCAHGYYGAAGSCALCPQGKYGLDVVAETEMERCAVCEAGRYAGSATLSISEAIGCPNLCAAGRYAPLSAQTTIAACSGECSAGKWSDSTGLSSDEQCTKCDLGLIGPNVAQTSRCVACSGRCSSGKHANSIAGLSSEAQCVDCAAGLFSGAATGLGSALQCVGTCPTGKFSVSLGQADDTSCTQCPSREFSFSPSECRACTGTEIPSVDQGSCIAKPLQVCAAGEYSPDLYTTCESCPRGRRGQSMSGTSSTCYDCGLGYFQASVGSVGCDACPANEVTGIDYQSSACALCAIGKLRDTGRIFCSSCLPGRYRSKAAVDFTCESCAQGKASAGLVDVSCYACIAGQFTNGLGKTACTNCEPGTFLPLADIGVEVACKTCVAGTVATSIKATICTDCGIGQIPNLIKGACINCAVGKFRSVTDYTCQTCAMGTASAALVDTKCEDCVAGQFTSRVGLTACSDCQPGSYLPTAVIATATECMFCALGTVAVGSKQTWCAVCAAGSIPDRAQTICERCRVGSYAAAGATVCTECGAVGMDCSGGVLKLLPGYWYDRKIRVESTTNRRRLSGSVELSGNTPVFECLNPAACGVVNGTAAECAPHSGGNLCAVCDAGFVPDANAIDGRCKQCESSDSERWSSKALMLGLVAAFFFLVGLVVITRPAPALKIDPLLVKLNIRRILLRARKRTLRKLHDRDQSAPQPVMGAATSARFIELLNSNRVDECASLRRAACAAAAAGAAASTMSATASAFGATLVDVGDDVGSGRNEAREMIARHMSARLHDVLGVEDVDGAMAQDGAHVHFAGASASAAGMATGALRKQIESLVKQISSMFSSEQLKIAMGNLQINASLTVVFAIPWPPLHTKFLGMLNIFKFDLFKGLSFAAPCLHSSHFMSLALFVAAPVVLIAVFALAFGCVALLSCVTRSCSRQWQQTARKLSCGQYTLTSAGGAALKLCIVIILFIYPTICSKVFLTFKCRDLGEGNRFMVASMQIPCFEKEWFMWAGIAAGSCLVYVVGIPAGLLLLLWCGHRRGALQYPKMKIGRGERVEPWMVADQLKRTDEHFVYRAAYASLYLQYEPRYWWFEFGCTMRKMILTGALVLFGADTSAQVVTALAVCIVWFAMISNFKPFGEDVDDRLAQVEALQVLFTLLLGLVLQLDAAAKVSETSSDDRFGLSIVLIALNCVVVGLAIIQQPIVRSMCARVVRIPSTIVRRAKGKREWEAAWIVPVTDGVLADTADAVWCDRGARPPRVLAARPIELVAPHPAENARTKSWYFDTDGNVVTNARRVVDEHNGGARIERWIDLDRKRVLDIPPTQLCEKASLTRGASGAFARTSGAFQRTYWFDVETGSLLHAVPGQLVLTDSKNEGARAVWRHRKSGVLVSENPGGAPRSSASRPERDSEIGAAASSAFARAHAAAAVQVTIAQVNPLRAQASLRLDGPSVELVATLANPLRDGVEIEVAQSQLDDTTNPMRRSSGANRRQLRRNARRQARGKGAAPAKTPNRGAATSRSERRRNVGAVARRKIASRMHELWRAGRLQSDGTYAPRVKTINSTEYDIANLSFSALPAELQKSNLSAAHAASTSVERACVDGKDLRSDGFIEWAAKRQHENWVAENNAWGDPALLVEYAELSEVEKEKDRVFVRSALEAYTEYASSLFASLGQEDRDEKTEHEFLRELASLVETMRAEGKINQDASAIELRQRTVKINMRTRLA